MTLHSFREVIAVGEQGVEGMHLVGCSFSCADLHFESSSHVGGKARYLCGRFEVSTSGSAEAGGAEKVP